MIERLCTRTNACGNTYQVEIDHDMQTVQCGYFIFRRDWCNSLTVGKRELMQYVKDLIVNGYIRL